MFVFMGIGLWQLLIYLLFMQDDLFNALGYRTYGLAEPWTQPSEVAIGTAGRSS